ncbi:hypothetical protein [Hymenobacter sp. BRD67]|uniref:hypothetical protein n=1 Tax=Hymenobacter sp. BRD67 TaxID=2675877 RepID=UPI001C264D9D|nr:hypothetical protein [Hymenobacter sp. BRD67]
MGEAYKKLISQWKEVLPTQTACLQMPIIMPQESNDAWAKQQKAAAQQVLSQPGSSNANTSLQDLH